SGVDRARLVDPRHHVPAPKDAGVARVLDEAESAGDELVVRHARARGSLAIGASSLEAHGVRNGQTLRRALRARWNDMAKGLWPVINVDNVEKSVEFYKSLGLKATVEDADMPGAEGRT